MAGNFEAVARLVTADILRIFTNTCVTPRCINRNQEEYFKRGGRKIGSSLDIRTAIRAIGADGQAFQPEGIVRVTVPLSINYWNQEALVWNDTEEAMFLDEDKRKAYLKPHAVNLANKVDRYMLQYMQSVVPNWIGTPGTALTTTTALNTIASAQTKLNQLLAFDADRTIIWNSYFNQPTVQQGAPLFNPQQIIGKQWLTGKIGRYDEFDIMLDEQVPSMTTGTIPGTATVDGANQQGTSILINGYTNNGTLSLSQGPGSDRVTLAGCYEINLQSHLTVPGVLKQFAVIAPVNDAAEAGSATLQIFPAIIPSGPYQNCSASPTSGGTVTLWGPNATICQTAFAFQEDAFTWVPIELQDVTEYGAKCMTMTDPETEISMRLVQQWDNRLGEITTRMDFVWGVASTECDHKALAIAG